MGLRREGNLLQPIRRTTRIRIGGLLWQSYLRRHFSRKPVVSRDVGCFFRLRTRLLLPNPIHICWCIRQLRLKVYEQSLLLLKTVVKGETETRVSFLEGGDFYSRSTMVSLALIYLSVLSKVGDKQDRSLVHSFYSRFLSSTG